MDFWFPFLGWVDLFLVCGNPLLLLLQIWTKLREGLWRRVVWRRVVCRERRGGDASV